MVIWGSIISNCPLKVVQMFEKSLSVVNVSSKFVSCHFVTLIPIAE